ncbi:MAG: hypothetical protein JNM72_27540 [Deltaproteobacteria bacterium]|nr:hypothetical protein [Deltaproteobacteria bacterium]
MRYRPGVALPPSAPAEAPAPPPAEAAGPELSTIDPRDIPPPPRATPKGRPKAPEPAPDPSRLPPELIAQLRELDASGRRITAFKTYREYTGVGFREAEEQVKKILDG